MKRSFTVPEHNRDKIRRGRTAGAGCLHEETIRCRRTAGVGRLHVVLAILILFMVVLISIPGWRAFKYKAQYIACEQAMKSAGDGLIIEFLNKWDEDDIDEARALLDEVMPARDDICPAHGNVYLIRNDQGIYEPVCGLHNKDVDLRTRLNANYTLSLLNETRKELRDAALKGSASEDDADGAGGVSGEDGSGSGEASGSKSGSEKTDTDADDAGGKSGSKSKKSSKTKKNKKNSNTESGSSSGYGWEEPDEITIKVNGKDLTCIRVQEEERIQLGTSLTNGYEGTVCFYGVRGDYTLSAKAEGHGYGDASEGDICYFVYADKDYCAIWRSGDGWTGSAYDAEDD